jgi:hypothetical protein
LPTIRRTKKFCFLCIKQWCKNKDTCPMCRASLTMGFLDSLNASDDMKIEQDDTDKWFYSGKKGGRWAFDPIMNTKLEELYQKYLKDEYDMDMHPIQIAGTTYLYDFENMKQISEHNNCRKIFRTKNVDSIKKSIKGIAGLKIS